MFIWSCFRSYLGTGEEPVTLSKPGNEWQMSLAMGGDRLGRFSWVSRLAVVCTEPVAAVGGSQCCAPRLLPLCLLQAFLAKQEASKHLGAYV